MSVESKCEVCRYPISTGITDKIEYFGCPVCDACKKDYDMKKKNHKKRPTPSWVKSLKED